MSDEKLKSAMRQKALSDASPLLTIMHKLTALVGLLAAKGIIDIDEYHAVCSRSQAQFDQQMEGYAEEVIEEKLSEMSEGEKALAKLFTDLTGLD